MPESAGEYAILAVAAFVAGVMNAVAGGGTLLTFPALMSIGLPATIANATSTVALLPGSFAGAWGYRKELRESRRFARTMLPVSLIGGIFGAILIVAYPDRFNVLVPWLILTAAVLFLLQVPLQRLLKQKQGDTTAPSARLGFALIGFQFLIATYGGYFGAGIGILMLTSLGFMGIGDIHKVNAVKTFLASAINAVSVVVFLWENLVRWDCVFAMVVPAIIGGYFGARVARKLPAKYVRWTVIAIGFSMAAYYFTRA